MLDPSSHQKERATQIPRTRGTDSEKFIPARKSPWRRTSNPLQYPYLENPTDRSKPYKLEVWGRFAKSAVVVTSFTNRLIFTCTVQQCGGPEAHISSVLSTQTFPWISRGLCPHTSLSILLLPSAPHCKCKGTAVVENNEFCCFQVPLG